MFKKILILLISGWYNAVFLHSQNHEFQTARSGALANSAIALPGGQMRTGNVAQPGWSPSLSLALHHETRFGLQELSTKGIDCFVPLQLTAIGMHYRYLGFSAYNQQLAGLSLSRKFGTRVSTGIQLNYQYARVLGQHHPGGTLSSEIGLLTKLSEELFLGVLLVNPESQLLGRQGNTFASSIRLGLGWVLPASVNLSLETEKDLEHPAIYKAGVEYPIISTLWLRGGIRTQPLLFSFGIGYQYKQGQLDLALSRHPVLGYSPQLSLVLVRR
jgi:hypothetical protein